MPIIVMDKVGEALNTKADIVTNNTSVFSTSGEDGVNFVQSTPFDAIRKEVASADFSLKQGRGLELLVAVFAPLGINKSKDKRSICRRCCLL